MWTGCFWHYTRASAACRLLLPDIVSSLKITTWKESHKSDFDENRSQPQQNEKEQKSAIPWQVSKDGDAFTISAPLITSSQSTPASLSLISCCIFDETDASNCKLPHFYFGFRYCYDMLKISSSVPIHRNRLVN